MSRAISTILVLAIGLAPISAFAQNYSMPNDSSPKIFFSSTHGAYIANGKEIDSSFWLARYDFGDTFATNPNAQYEYNQYQNLITWFPYLNWGALGLAFTYGIVSSANNTYNDGVFWLSFLIPWISGIIVGGHAQAHLQRAINLYNGVDPRLARDSTFPDSRLPSSEARLSRLMTSPKVALNLFQIDF